MQNFYTQYIAEVKDRQDWRFLLARVNLEQLKSLREDTRSWINWDD